ncbi:MAG: hypothetical protein ABSB76_36685 [Streptosporangiaceae bacterium]|jgi:hypothetical protein
MTLQRGDQRRGKRFGEKALRDLGPGQDEDPVTAVLVIAVIPPDPGTVKSSSHGLIKPVADLNLMPISTTRITETLYVNNDDSAVNRQPTIHLLPPPGKAERTPSN